MNYLSLIIMLSIGTFAQAAETKITPAKETQILNLKAEIPNDIIGGQLLMIGRKGVLAIDRPTNKLLESELGSETKQSFFTDLIMEVPADEVSKKYVSKDSSAIQSVVTRYASLFPLKVDVIRRP
jgi:hypothetical protein